MNETAIVPTRVELDTLEDLGNMMLTSGYFDGVGKVAQAAVKVLAGREVGLGPVASMRLLHIVDGKIEMSADLLAMRVKEHPRYDYRVREITGRCGESAAYGRCAGRAPQRRERAPRSKHVRARMRGD